MITFARLFNEPDWGRVYPTSGRTYGEEWAVISSLVETVGWLVIFVWIANHLSELWFGGDSIISRRSNNRFGLGALLILVVWRWVYWFPAIWIPFVIILLLLPLVIWLEEEPESR